MFIRGSRYYEVEQAEWKSPDGRSVRYVRRRFVPRAMAVEAQATYAVVEGDRLDNLTARYLGDAEQFWRLADANFAVQPDELTAEIGRILIIPAPSAEGWSR
jgi:hypothetical protein